MVFDGGRILNINYIITKNFEIVNLNCEVISFFKNSTRTKKVNFPLQKEYEQVYNGPFLGANSMV
jgi:hypothetical protein